jgi:hypothetical protein
MLVEARVHACYLHHYGASSEWRDKSINIFLAVMSSSSIAAWAIWREFTWVWPALIAGSQVVSAVKPFLPYNRQHKVVVILADAIQSICLKIENSWFSVAEGLLPDHQIHEETIEFRGLLLDAERKAMDGTILPRKQKFMDMAEVDARRYFETHYPTGSTQ